MQNATTSIARRAYESCATSCLRSKHVPHRLRLKRACVRLDKTSNKLLGFTQTLTKVRGTRTLATTNANVSYSLDAAGNLTSDGLRSFEYDPANRLAKLKILKDGEASSISYLHNSLGQRVFKGEPVAEQTLPNQAVLGEDFITYLRRQFGWLFTAAQANASIGTAFTYADGQLPEWALLGEYDNGSASGKGRTEYLWLPTDDGGAVPVGIYRNGKFFAVHADHLGTPRLITNEANQPVWQWPYSAFGNNKPTGILKATPNPRAAITNQPVLLRATNPAAVVDLRFPGQHADDEAGVFYNYQRNYQAGQGRYTQNDPIGLDGGLNRFAYVGGNPVSRIDPTGLLYVAIRFEFSNTFIVLHAKDGREINFPTYEGFFTIPNAPCNFLCFIKDKDFDKARDQNEKTKSCGAS